MATHPSARRFPRWPLLFIAAGAAVAVWSGWVGLGELAGFGPVQVLPGIAGGFTLNTAIVLPVGVEAYGAYALGAWLRGGPIPDHARTFAKRSAVGALLLGMTGQVVFHLLAAAHATVAPWPVTVLVSCMPVAVLGLSAALAHLLRDPGTEPATPRAGSVPAVSPPVSAARKEPIREVMRRHKVSQPTAVKMRNYAAAQVRASMNGHGPE